jgi:hypothetical protein
MHEKECFMPVLTNSGLSHVVAHRRQSSPSIPPVVRHVHAVMADELPPRFAVIAPEESIAIVSHVSSTHGPITSEMARGATLRRGELVLVVDSDDAWAGVVRRVSARGAWVEEQPSPW